MCIYEAAVITARGRVGKQDGNKREGHPVRIWRARRTTARAQHHAFLLLLSAGAMAESASDATDKNVEMWKIKRLIKSLEAARG